MDRIIVQRPEKTSTAEMMRNSYWKKTKLRTVVRIYKNSRNHGPGFQSGDKK
jgi:hypothetical protein